MGVPVAAAVLLLAGRPALAQEAASESMRLPPRFTTGVALLHPLTESLLGTDIPAFRAGVSWALDPAFAIEAGALQVAGETVIVQGASAGARWNVQAGPFRIRPGAELVVGRAIVDAGGWYVQDDAGGFRYRPYRRPSDGPAVGGGGLISVDWIPRLGVGLEALLGYWYTVAPERSGALVLGAGLRQAIRDAEWYWRSSGQDDAPPRFDVESPEPGADGVRVLGPDGLRIVAADRSGIRAIEVDGVPIHLAPSKAAAAEVPGMSGKAAVAVLRPPIHEGTHPLRIEVWDGAGNRAERVVRVAAATPVPPATVITGPATDAPVAARYVDVRGAAMSATTGLRVEIDGCVAAAYADLVSGTPAHVFNLRVPIAPGPNRIEIETIDPLRGRTTLVHEIQGAPIDEAATHDARPRFSLSRAPSVSGRAVRVSGDIADPDGIGLRDVRVDGSPAALSYRSGTRVDGGFLAYVPRNAADAAEVVATTFDGRTDSVSVTPSAPRRTPPAGAALLVGIDDYAADHIAGPAGAAASATALAELLRRRAAADLPAERVRLLTGPDATERQIREAMQWLAATSRSVDVVYVYLAGRAVRGAAGAALGLVPHDAPATYGPGSIAWTELDQLFRSLRAEVVVLTELSDGDGRAVPPPMDAACGPAPLPRGGLAVLAATDRADGAFSRRALDTLAGTPTGGAPVLLSDLIRALNGGTGSGPALRTRGPIFDPTLPLTRGPHVF
ncbi:MAG TPA: hypothetical protein VF158_12660 [Longimicrobiales bacterium]